MDIELKKVSKTYKMGETHVRALRKVDLYIRSGEHLTIMGPSGSGKTTLLNMIGLLDKPTKGQVLLDMEDTGRLSDGKRSRIRLEKFGFIFQQFYLLPSLNALQNVYLPMKEAGLAGSRGKKKAAELLEDVGVANRASHLPSQLSGGEQQRIAIARALANDPFVILADEPTGELDSAHSMSIIELLRRLNKDMGKTVVVVSHDPEVARKAKRTVKMIDGKVSR